MSRRESYKAPLHRSKFMVDFWLGVYQFKQILTQRRKDLENDVFIPKFFSPTSGKSSDRCIDDVDIYDVDTSLRNMKNLQDKIFPDLYTHLLSALQLQHSLHAAIEANLMTTRVTGYIKKKKSFSPFVNKNKGAAHLTTDTKLTPDVTSLEYQVCHAVMYMLQVEFVEVATQLNVKVNRTMDHIRGILGATLREVDTSLTVEALDDSGVFLWSNPDFLTNWAAYVTSLRQEDEAESAPDEKRKSVFTKIRKSVSHSLNKKSHAVEHAQQTPFTRAMTLAPLHETYLQIMQQLNTPSSSCYFEKFTQISGPRSRVMSDVSSDGSEVAAPKWYFGKLVGRRPPGERRRSSTSSAASDDKGEDDKEEDEDFVTAYAKAFGVVFVSEEENAAVEVDHRLIHSVVIDAPPLTPGGKDQDVPVPNDLSSSNPDVRLFSWYMYVVMHNSRCVAEKLKIIRGIHEALDASVAKDTDKQCLQDYSTAGKCMMDNIVSTTQIIRSMRELFTEEEDEADTLNHQHALRHLCMHVTQHWLKEAQKALLVVQQFKTMRHKNVSVMIKSAMPICSEEEVEAVVTHDDGAHVHKLIAAINNGHTEVARMLEARLRGPQSGPYTDMKLFCDQAQSVVTGMGTMLETPLKLLQC